MKWLMVVLVPLIVFVFGCGRPYTLGTPIEKPKVDQIVPGSTPEAKIVEMFGQPVKKEATGGGGMKYVYSSYRETPQFWSKNIQEKSLLEIYLQNEIVQRYEVKKEGIDDVGK